MIIIKPNTKAINVKICLIVKDNIIEINEWKNVKQIVP